jgi:predicted unusual protein kinase regulating ubiquinone biosynthesis (AarF/ABC1/UbiB family)
MSDGDDPKQPPKSESPSGPTSSRFSRFAKITGLSASVAARHLTQKVVSAFTDEESAQESERRAMAQSAEQMRKTLGELKGAAMKVGQMLATDPEILPPEIAEQLSQLQHSAPPMDLATVRGVVEGALEQKLEDVFTSFSEKPIGAASIGQVHRATTKDGMNVAVKVQYPGIADTIASDMKNLGSLLVIARAQLPKDRVDAYLDEVTTVLQKESDYLNEADNLERFQVLLKDVEGVRVPIPVHELTRKQVLVMELFEGERLEDWLAKAPPEQKTVQGRRFLKAYLEMIHRHGALHADPHPGNFLVLTTMESSNGAPTGGRLSGGGPASGSAGAGEGLATATPENGVPPIGILDLGCVRDYPVGFMDDQLRLLAGLWKHDIQALQTTWRKLGFMDKGVDPELIYDWLQLIFEPLTSNKITDFGTWKIHETALRFVLDNPSIKLWAPPREVLFYVRVLAGLRALMHKVGMRLNVYELSREVCRERGIIA